MATLRILALGLWVLPLLSVGQPTLTHEKNAMRGGDVIVKQQVKYVNPGRSGRMVIWDFGRLTNVDEAYTTTYREYQSHSGEPCVAATEHHTRYHYSRRNDTLLLLRQENPSMEISYAAPDLQLTYPFAYGSRAKHDFKGSGSYSRVMPIQVSGSSEIFADAYGLIITPRGDTLSNILRVKTTKTYHEVKKGESSSIQVEKYTWYAKGYRYPVFETVKTSTLLSGKEESEHFTTAFYFPPQQQHLLPVDWENEDDRDISKEEMFTYHSVYPNPCINELTVEYNVGQTAKIYLGLYNQQGQQLRSIVNGEQQELGSYAYSVSMSNLMPGLYLLKLRVGDRELSKRVVKK